MTYKSIPQSQHTAAAKQIALEFFLATRPSINFSSHPSIKLPLVHPSSFFLYFFHLKYEHQLAVRFQQPGSKQGPSMRSANPRGCIPSVIFFFYFSPRMLQSVSKTFSSRGVGSGKNMQRIRPATYPLLVLSQCLYVIQDWLCLLGFSGVN
jgi:hypothetical protein